MSLNIAPTAFATASATALCATPSVSLCMHVHCHSTASATALRAALSVSLCMHVHCHALGGAGARAYLPATLPLLHGAVWSAGDQ